MPSEALCLKLIKEIGEETGLDLLKLIKDKDGFDFLKVIFAEKIFEDNDEREEAAELEDAKAAELEDAAVAPVARIGERVPDKERPSFEGRRTMLYRITNGFATKWNNRPVEMVLQGTFETEMDAFNELFELCGYKIGARRHTNLWFAYHTHNYIHPYLFKNQLMKVYGQDEHLPKTGVRGTLGGLKIPVDETTQQYVIVIEDHVNHPEKRFPWGAKFIKPT